METRSVVEESHAQPSPILANRQLPNSPTRGYRFSLSPPEGRGPGRGRPLLIRKKFVQFVSPHHVSRITHHSPTALLRCLGELLFTIRFLFSAFPLLLYTSPLPEPPDQERFAICRHSEGQTITFHILPDLWLPNCPFGINIRHPAGQRQRRAPYHPGPPAQVKRRVKVIRAESPFHRLASNHRNAPPHLSPGYQMQINRSPCMGRAVGAQISFQFRFRGALPIRWYGIGPLALRHHALANKTAVTIQVVLT
jgi:hypothetical protein